MNTPTHLLLGAAVFAKPHDQRVTVAAILGSFVPDLSLYVLTAWSIYVQGVEAETVFRVYYYTAEWQQIFAVDNSFILWGCAFGVAVWARSATFIAFCGAALLHLAFDFPVHNHDARMHFWPVSDWVFISPLSYWDRGHYAGYVGPVEMVLALAACFVLWRRFNGMVARSLIIVAASLQLAPGLVWAWVFASNP